MKARSVSMLFPYGKMVKRFGQEAGDGLRVKVGRGSNRSRALPIQSCLLSHAAPVAGAMCESNKYKLLSLFSKAEADLKENGWKWARNERKLQEHECNMKETWQDINAKWKEVNTRKEKNGIPARWKERERKQEIDATWKGTQGTSKGKGRSKNNATLSVYGLKEPENVTSLELHERGRAWSTGVIVFWTGKMWAGGRKCNTRFWLLQKL